MPRGVKGSRKKAKTETVVVEKTRKAYPTLDERIAIADKKVESLTKLNNEREVLVAKTEKKLEERKVALARSTEQLNKVLLSVMKAKGISMEELLARLEQQS